MNVLPFMVPYVVPAVIVTSHISGASWGFQAVVWIYLAAAALDVFPGPKQPVGTEAGPGWRLAIWLWAPAHMAALASGLSAIGSRALAQGETWTMVLQAGIALGMTGGMFGVVVAHELMHGSSRREGLLAETLMMMLSYPHWCIEHIKGHHRRVGTREDPATARLGESFYEFYPRAVIGGVRSAWRIERTRLQRLGRPAVCGDNRMLRYGMSLGAVYATVYMLFGTAGVAMFACQGLVAFSVLEVINYIGHYGLTRAEVTAGIYEPVALKHSWNSSYAASNWLLFRVGLHADHHCHPGKSYERLEDCEEAPQLPAGYLAMFVLALIPPAWQWVMDGRAEEWWKRETSQGLRGMRTRGGK